MRTEETMRLMLREFEAQARQRVKQAHLDYPFAEGVLNTEQVPPEGPFVLSGPATDVEANKLRHSAAAFRRMLDATLGFRQGVVYTRGTCTDLKVTATGSDVNISVAAGAAFVRGTQAAGAQGMYHAYNDAAKTINVLGPNPAHATLNRIDLVVFRINDTFYSGATDNCSLEMVTGTPNASPTVPAVPANSLILAQILIPAASAVIAIANITDRRVPAGNGVIVLDDILIGTDGRYLGAGAQITFLNPGGSGINLIPPGLEELWIEWYARGDTAANSTALNARLNNISTATYDSQYVQGVAAAASAAEALAQTSMQIGDIPAGTATANYFGAGDARIKNPGGAVGNKVVVANAQLAYADTTGTMTTKHFSGKWRTTGAPVTRVDLLPGAGNFVVGSRFVLKAAVGIQP